MLRKVYLFAITLLSANTVSAQENTDPTFNGLVNYLSCSINTIVRCQDEVCVPIINVTHMGSSIRMELDLAKREFKNPGENGKPMQSITTSAAQINKPINFTFTVPDGNNVKFIVVGQPQGGGNYQYLISGTAKKDEGLISLIGRCDRMM